MVNVVGYNDYAYMGFKNQWKLKRTKSELALDSEEETEDGTPVMTTMTEESEL